jgi:hypothetical protein
MATYVGGRHAEVDISDERVRKILVTLLLEGPLNQYQIEKGTKLKHSTMVQLFKPMIELQYVDLASKEIFRTGLESRHYKISPGGFFELMRERKAEYKDQDLARAEASIWSQSDAFIERNQEWSPWLYEQLLFLRRIGAAGLFKYLFGMVIGLTDYMVLVDARHPAPRAISQRIEVDQRRLDEDFGAFVLRILYPGADLDFSGFHIHPWSWSKVTSDQDTLQSMQKQIKKYLLARKEFALFITERLEKTEARLDLAQSEIRAIRADFITSTKAQPRVYGPSG